MTRPRGKIPPVSPSDTPPSGDDPGVLSGLSRTRPQRRSNKRPGRPATADGPAPTEAQPQAAADPPAPRKAATRAATAGSKKSTTATTPPAKAAKGPAKAARTSKQEPPAVEVGRAAEPRAERPAAAADQHADGVDLIGQAIQAAGEVAQLGVGLGRQVAKGILSRLPKP